MLTLDSTPSGAWARRRQPVSAIFPERRPEVDCIDGCELLHLIGNGSMGEVYLASAPDRTGRRRPVALKRLHPRWHDDALMHARFAEEAQLIGMLTGPGFVRAIDVSKARSHLYFTMEFIDGATLADVIHRASRAGVTLPSEVALQITRNVAASLDRLHRHTSGNLVHCDVSPANLLITPQGQVRLVDFGICRGAHQTVSPMHAGRILGTPRYMSPEQLAGEDVSGRSDLFALGLVMHEMLTGIPAFDAAGDEALDTQVRRASVVPPRLRVPAIQAEIDALVMRALRPNPDVRFQSAALMQRAIERTQERLGLESSARVVASFLRSLD